MSPFRLIVLLFLFYMLYRLLTGGKRGTDRKKTASNGSAPPSHDVLVEDPVCHTYVPQSQAVAWRKDGTTHYFCSEKCREQYITASKEKNA